ncbi:MAG TPA: hypothetical protein VLY63_28020 [Anaerolineae bacterium]|nr:hypothetical protein [Anaerolineae bacterium]
MQPPGRYRVEFLNGCGEGETCRDTPIPVLEDRSGDGLGSALQTSTITIVKNADPADGIDFTFNSNLGTFALDDAVPDDSDAVPDSRAFEVASSVDWPFTEQAPPGWDLNNIVCTYSTLDTLISAILDGGSLVGVTIRPALEDDVTCTFYNQLPSSSTITIVKNANPADGTDFTFNGNRGTFALDDAVPDDSDAVPDSIVFEVTPSTDWSFVEQAPLFWDLSSIACTYSNIDTLISFLRDDGRLVGVTIRPVPEEDVTCTFDNQKGTVYSTYLPFASKKDLSP